MQLLLTHSHPGPVNLDDTVQDIKQVSTVYKIKSIRLGHILKN